MQLEDGNQFIVMAITLEALRRLQRAGSERPPQWFVGFE